MKVDICYLAVTHKTIEVSDEYAQLDAMTCNMDDKMSLLDEKLSETAFDAAYEDKNYDQMLAVRDHDTQRALILW